jgi:hypothetical protein
MKILIVSVLLWLAAPTWSDPVPGSMVVRWNEGAADCERSPQPPLQVHRYEPQTYILRQSPWADAEASSMYCSSATKKRSSSTLPRWRRSFSCSSCGVCAGHGIAGAALA